MPKQSMAGYMSGERIPSADRLFSLSDVLDMDPRLLLTGETRVTGSLVAADDANWIDVPEYDLREMSDETLGVPLHSAPMRVDWLQSTFRAASNLWLTRLLSDYAPAGLTEGTLVVCRSLSVDQLADGNVCLWRVAGGVVIGRFSLIPDVQAAQGIVGANAPDQRHRGGALAAFVDPSLGLGVTDLVVPPSRIGPHAYSLVGRVLGVMMRPL